MRDNTFYQSDAAVAADAFAGAFNIDGSPADGIWLQFVVTRNDSDTDETLEVSVYGKGSDSSWATTDQLVSGNFKLVNADIANGATVVRYLHVNTKLDYINPYYNVGGTTPSWTIACAVVSGPDQKQTAALA